MTGSTTSRQDVNLTADTGKPVREREQGGIVHSRATIEFPEWPAFKLQISYDGALVPTAGGWSRNVYKYQCATGWCVSGLG